MHDAAPRLDDPQGVSSESLLAHLQRVQADLRTTVASKRSLVRASRVIERVALADGDEATVLACFQHERHWRSARRRYAAMGTEPVVLFAPADAARPESAAEGPVLVALDAEDPFVSEWFVVALGPTASRPSRPSTCTPPRAAARCSRRGPSRRS